MYDLFTRMGEDWKQDAACREFPLPKYEGWWFPAPKEPIDPMAKKTCASCPVQAQCLEFGMQLEGNVSAIRREGVYAGTNGRDRYKLWRQRTQTPARLQSARPPEMVECECGCGEVFDANTTTQGKRSAVPRRFASTSCQRTYTHHKAIKTVTCKLDECNVTFEKNTRMDGKRGSNTARSYCSLEHAREGIRRTRSQRRAS